MSLQNIFGNPVQLEGYDKNHPLNIYPVLLEKYDAFSDISKFLYVSKNNFAETDIPLLQLVLMVHKELGETFESLIDKMCKALEMVTKSPVGFMDGKDMFAFVVNNENYITIANYDEVRKTIMEQNLIHEPKVYKDPLVQEWANKVLQARQKKQGKTTLEDMITTVKAYQGITYEHIAKQTVYQLYADFYRICKIMNFEQSSLFATVSSKEISIEYFAQSIDLFEESNPYKDLFVSSNKLNKLNQTVK